MEERCILSTFVAVLQVVTPEKYEVKGSVEEAAIILTSCSEPKMQVTITLTSPVIREDGVQEGGWRRPAVSPLLSTPPSLPPSLSTPPLSPALHRYISLSIYIFLFISPNQSDLMGPRIESDS